MCVCVCVGGSQDALSLSLSHTNTQNPGNKSHPVAYTYRDSHTIILKHKYPDIVHTHTHTHNIPQHEEHAKSTVVTHAFMVYPIPPHRTHNPNTHTTLTHTHTHTHNYVL